jgi:hypothetical protein
MPYTLANNASYKAKITVYNARGVASLTSTRTFNVSYTAPPTPELALSNDNETGIITCTIDNKTINVLTEGNLLILSGGATVQGTDAILNAQYAQAAKTYTSLGGGKYKFYVTESCTATVTNDMRITIYDTTAQTSVNTTMFTPAQASTEYSLEFTAISGHVYECRVRKEQTTANTITIDKVRIQESVSVEYNDLYRKDESGTSIRIASGLPANSTFTDYFAASNTNYYYIANAIGGGTAALSQYTTIMPQFDSLLIFLASSPQDYLQLKMYSEITLSRRYETSELIFVGRELPVFEYGEHRSESLQLNIRIAKNEVDKKKKLENLLHTKQILALREGTQGVCLFGIVKEYEVKCFVWGYEIPITLQVSNYSIEV